MPKVNGKEEDGKKKRAQNIGWCCVGRKRVRQPMGILRRCLSPGHIESWDWRLN